MGETPLVVAPRGRDSVGSAPMAAAVGTTAVAFGLLGGPLAAVLTLVPAAVLVLGGPVLAFVAATIAFLGLGSAVGVAPIPAALAAAGFLLASTYDTHGPRTAGIYLASAVATVGTFVVARALLDGLLTTTAVVLGGLAFVGYGIHRYELLVMGLLDE
jgi:hypothetical protein